jgi:GNAT superfamily N-acetyltransferase
MEIRAIDPSDADELRRFYDVSYHAEMADGRDWNGHWTYDEVASMLLDATPEDRSAGLAVYDGDRLVGSGVMSWSDVANTDKCFVFPLVDPPERGRGVGSALLEAMVDDCRARGRTTVTSSTAYAGPERDDAPAVRFAAKHGFQVANTEIHRHLDLPVPDALLDEVDAEGAAYREGYTIETFVGEVPEELLASYCDLLNQLIVDAPSGEVDYEAGAHTPESLREQMAVQRRIGRRVYFSAAVRDGVAVAQSDLALQTGGDTAVQWGTYVHREHRGHRLGAAVKVANLRAVQRDRPDIKRVDTSNAETNSWMVAINERLGFRVVAVSPSFVRRLGAGVNADHDEHQPTPATD